MALMHRKIIIAEAAEREGSRLAQMGFRFLRKGTTLLSAMRAS